jgi:2,4-dienoyl-CoA reductase-like NADH-dependent reductase (Old Yellow Enzyme family)
LDDDRYPHGLQRLTDAVHAHGTPIFAELMPGFGRMAKPSVQWPMIAASPRNLVISRHHLPRAVTAPIDRVLPVPREATRDEIQQLEREAQHFRRALTAPIVLGSIHDPVAAATAIADGHGDAVMLARPLLADPQYPNKVKEGRFGAIVVPTATTIAFAGWCSACRCAAR